MTRLSNPLTAAAASRRRFLQGAGARGMAALLATPLLSSLGGCIATAAASPAERVWGRRGFSDGRFLKPRAITIDADDLLYIVDTTGRIQVFDTDGNFRHGWKTPETDFGRPTGLSIKPTTGDAPPVLLVADTHYYRMLAFQLSGQPLPDGQIGGTAGHDPGEFAFVTDAISDRQGNYYIGEYGDSDRIQKFDPEGNFLCQWGGTGSDDGRFVRPQSLVIDAQHRLWVVDACNHRIQRFDLTSTPPKFLDSFGSLGSELGQFYYPYDLAIASDGTVIVCEYGNQRLQRLDDRGRGIATWGSPGHAAGQLYQPWGVVIDSRGRIHVLDSNNHRVQRLQMFG